MKITVLSSGSKGNSTLIETKDKNILIDAGLPLSNLEKRKNPLPKIDILIITHVHNDHIKGVNSIIKKYNPLIYTKSDEVIEEITSNNLTTKEKLLFEETEITLFPLSHDVSCYGVKIREENKELVYITDTGYINYKILKEIKNKDIYIIESNHDVEMLRNGRYPEYLRNRVLSDNGHLSNEQASEYLKKVIGPNTKHIILAHLSEENNTEELAYQKTEQELNDKNKIIHIAKQHEALETIEV